MKKIKIQNTHIQALRGTKNDTTLKMTTEIKKNGIKRKRYMSILHGPPSRNGWMRDNDTHSDMSR